MIRLVKCKVDKKAWRRYGIQHNDIQHNVTEHKELICDIQHKCH
jgi:hypothetical protein